MKELTYEEVLDQIEHQRRFGNRPGAEVSALMLEKLGRPQQMCRNREKIRCRTSGMF